MKPGVVLMLVILGSGILIAGLGRLGLLLLSCSGVVGGLSDGLWRGELSVQGRPAPFMFEVSGAGSDTASVTLLNGVERVYLSPVRSDSDAVVIPIAAYDTHLRGSFRDGILVGSFRRNYISDDPGVEFRAARAGVLGRFPVAVSPTEISVSGRWDVYFMYAGDTVRNVGVFHEEGGIVTGSILTNSGDLRYLEGALTSDGAQLSAFSGQTPYLLELRFTTQDTFEGFFYTSRSRTLIRGVRNGGATLDDPYSLTRMQKGKSKLSFRLPDTEGNMVSLSDVRFRGKVVIVSILGSWCPNCLDEIGYLSPWYRENVDRGIEIVGLAFERKPDLGYARQAVLSLIERYDISYPILLAGAASPVTIEHVLPELASFSSYPTTIFIDRRGVVRRIHTGFSGPATGVFYEEFKSDFNALINTLLSE